MAPAWVRHFHAQWADQVEVCLTGLDETPWEDLPKPVQAILLEIVRRWKVRVDRKRRKK